ncbi:MAG: ABC transporter ATP-binding protein [Candidatus Saccharibacteria bacterium]
MDEKSVITVDHLNKNFKLPLERSNSVKSALINIFRHKKGYEILHALKDVNFDVKEGEFFGIVGRNGSGKSTLLKILAGIYAPTEGGLNVVGKLVPFIELGVGFNPELTGRENVYLNGALLGFNRKEMKSMYDDIVGFAELSRFMDQKLKNYSSGMQVRLAFSIAIRARGDILLLDEVLAVGDAAFQQKCFDYFETLKKQKKTVVFVSHDMLAVSRFCTRAIYVKNGEIIRIGDPEEIAEIYKLENIETAEQRQKNSGTTGPKLSDNHKLSAKIIEETKDNIKIRFKHKSADKEAMYVGFSVIRDGIAVAEITNEPKDIKDALYGDGELTYDLDISSLNVGVYQITTVLSAVENRRLLAVSRTPLKFAISGKDINRGGAIRLANNWH